MHICLTDKLSVVCVMFMEMKLKSTCVVAGCFEDYICMCMRLCGLVRFNRKLRWALMGRKQLHCSTGMSLQGSALPHHHLQRPLVRYVPGYFGMGSFEGAQSTSAARESVHGGAAVLDQDDRLCWLAETATTFPSDGQLDSFCLLYTSPSPRDGLLSRMPSSA